MKDRHLTFKLPGDGPSIEFPFPPDFFTLKFGNSLTEPGSYIRFDARYGIGQAPVPSVIVNPVPLLPDIGDWEGLSTREAQDRLLPHLDDDTLDWLIANHSYECCFCGWGYFGKPAAEWTPSKSLVCPDCLEKINHGIYPERLGEENPS